MGRIGLAKTGTNSLPVPGLLTRKNRLDRSKDHVELVIRIRSPSGVAVGGLAANRRLVGAGVAVKPRQCLGNAKERGESHRLDGCRVGA